MELKQIALTLWKWWWLLVLAALAAAGVSLVNDRQLPRIYRTAATVQVGQFLQSTNPQPQDFATSQQLAQAYAQMVRQQPILQATIDALGLEIQAGGLAGQVGVTVPPGSALIQISVADVDPVRAKEVADELARQLIARSPTPSNEADEGNRRFIELQLNTLRDRILEADAQISALEERIAQETSARAIQDIQSQQAILQQKIAGWQSNYASLLDYFKGGRVNFLTFVDPAVVPTAPVSPDTRLNLALAVAIALLLAGSAAFLIEYLDDTVRTGEDVERVLAVPTLGAISRMRKIAKPADLLAALHAPRSLAAEGYRVLHTNIQFSSLALPADRLLVTSAGPGEGKTTVAGNLAVTMARSGKRVILADADLRRPTMHQLFGVTNRVGLTSLLLDESLPLDTALVDTPVAGLRMLPSGPLPPNPAELLGSEPMRRRVDEMAKLADVVIFDGRSVLGVADAVILGALCSGVVLVVNSRRTRSGLLRRAKAALDQVDLRILGVVLNKQAGRPAGDYGWYAVPDAGRGWRRVSAAMTSLFGGVQ